MNRYNQIRREQKFRQRNAQSMRPSFFWKNVYQFNLRAIPFNNWELTDSQVLTDSKLLSPASALAAQQVGFALGETLCFRCGFRQNEETEVLLSERWVWVRSWRRAHPVGHWNSQMGPVEPDWSLGSIGSWNSRWHPLNWNKEVVKLCFKSVNGSCGAKSVYFCWHFLTNGAICTLCFVFHSLCFFYCIMPETRY